jgi:hypothetical protein
MVATFAGARGGASRIIPHPNRNDADAASTSVVSADVHSKVRTERRTRRIGAWNRYREFGGEWRVSDTAKAKSAKSTSSLYAL